MIQVIQQRDFESKKPLIGKCRCGRKIEFFGHGQDEACDCGRWYNSSGQELKPPREWGEDTGERFDDFGHYVGGGDY